MSVVMWDVLIVGAGLSGLNLARELKGHQPQLKIQILEKSKGCGGRMATRRVEDSRFDHGAQFIRSSKSSQKLIHFWQEQNVLVKFPTEAFEAYCGRSGMTELAKKMAVSLPVSYNLKVKKLIRRGAHWQVLLEDGGSLESSQVVLTCPLPQSLEILSQSEIPFDPGLSRVLYQKAIALLVELDSALAAEMNYAENVDRDIFSVCSQQAKGLSKRPEYTVVMNGGWTESHFDQTDEDIAAAAQALLRQKFPRRSLLNLQVKKWRYAQPLQIWSSLFANPAMGLYLVGDAFGGASLNGALQSSNAWVEHFLQMRMEQGSRA